MEKNDTSSAIAADLGIAPRSEPNTLTVRSQTSRADVMRLSGDIQTYTSDLLARSAPETIGQRVLDVFVPSPIRAEKRRAETELVKARLNSRVEAAHIFYAAQNQQMQALAESYVKAAKLQTAEEVAMRGIEAATKVDGEIERSGDAFDQALDQAVRAAEKLETNSAKLAAADRIGRRIALRAAIEDAAMEGVKEAVKGVKDRS